MCVTPAGNGSATATTTVSCRLPPAGTTRSLQLTVPATWLPPWSAETNVVFGSSGSVTPTPVASLPPTWASVIVYVSSSPASASPLPLASTTDLDSVIAASTGITTHCGPPGGH